MDYFNKGSHTNTREAKDIDIFGTPYLVDGSVFLLRPYRITQGLWYLIAGLYRK